MEFHSRVFLTGAKGFTGGHLTSFLSNNGYEVIHLTSDLLDTANLNNELLSANPDFVIHLAGISFDGHANKNNFYRVNTIGSINLLESCRKLEGVKRVILASSAAVYGNQANPVLDETLCPRPVSNYGCSKLSMELLAENYIQYFPITVVRPFNYTGVGHDEIFVIPKLVKCFKEKVGEISLGNIDVYREFNDVRDVCTIYEKLLSIESQFNLVNICSGRLVGLNDILQILEIKCRYKPSINIDEKFVRRDEVKNVCGSEKRLRELTGYRFKYSIEDTLNWMLKC